MPIEILMPALSPTMEDGTLAKWHVKEGDEVSSGDVLAEIETDKATMEFEAVDEGVLGKILVPEGQESVKVNVPIAVLLEEGETTEDIVVPSPSAAPSSDQSAPSPAAGGDENASSPQTADKAPEASASQSSTSARVFASPLARRIAKNKGLDLATLKGSGPRGRIVKTDVEEALARPAPQAQQAGKTDDRKQEAAPQGPATDAVLASYAGRPYEEVTLDGMRKIIAARLTEAKQSVPHFYLRRDIQLDALLAFRSQLNQTLAARDIKLSVNDFIIKACALALQQVPAANAVWASDRILQLKHSDIAVAVAVEGGLFTPVLQDAEVKSLSALSGEMKDLATRARARKLAPHEYQGGSFAISNLGMFGIDNFDAIINPPHAAILAVGAGVKQPVVDDSGELSVATVMSTTLSVDHRVIDGALGAELLQAIKDNLENPLVMLA